jgi:hypothetical protein
MDHVLIVEDRHLVCCMVWALYFSLNCNEVAKNHDEMNVDRLEKEVNYHFLLPSGAGMREEVGREERQSRCRRVSANEDFHCTVTN